MKDKVLAIILTVMVMVGVICSCIVPSEAETIYIEELNIYDSIDYDELDKGINEALGIETDKNDIPEETPEPSPEPTPEPTPAPEPKKVAKPKATPKPTPTPEPVVETPEPEVVSEQPEMTYLYSAYVTGYCPYCAHCCGQTSGITASGQKAVPWGTVASNTLPFGTRIYIEGLGYFTVNDTGGMSGNTIDLCVNTHDEAYAITGTYKIYRVN